MVKCIGEVGVEELVEAGLTVEEASELERLIKDASNSKWWFEPTDLWREVVARRLLKPWHPHAVHQPVYYSVFAHWDVSTRGPPPN